MKRKSVDQVKTPSKIKPNDKSLIKMSPKVKTPFKNTPVKTPSEIKPNNKSLIKMSPKVKTPFKNTPVKTPSKIKMDSNSTNGLSVGKTTPKKFVQMPSEVKKKEKNTEMSGTEEATPKKGSRKHLIVEKKSDKDLFSLNNLTDDVDMIENIDEDEFLGSSSEDEVEGKEKIGDSEEESDEEEEEEDEDEDEEDEDDSESDEAVDEKLIADDSSDDEEETDKSKKDFGQSSVLISSPSFIKKKKLVKFLSKLEVNITRCLHLYTNTLLVSCKTPAEAQVLLAPNADLQINESPLRVSKLPFFVVLENLPNYIKSEDVKKAVSSCIELSAIKSIVFLHINKCFVEFATEQAYEKFTKKVTKLNISGKKVRLVPWLDKILLEFSLRRIKASHLPPKATVEILMRKLLEHGVERKEIYQLKFFTRNTASILVASEETEKKILALNFKIQFEKGPVYFSLSTNKVVLTGVPESTKEKKIRKALKAGGIDLSKIHSIIVQGTKATVECKTKEEEQKIIELESLEIEGSTVRVVPLCLFRKDVVTIGLLKLPSSVSVTEVLEAMAAEGHQFDSKDVELERGEKNSVLLILNGSDDLKLKLSSLKALQIGKSSIKVTFCKFGTQKEAVCSRKSDHKRTQKRKRKDNKEKPKQNKKQKKDAKQSD